MKWEINRRKVIFNLRLRANNFFQERLIDDNLEFGQKKRVQFSFDNL